MHNQSEGAQILVTAAVGADREFEKGEQVRLHRFKLLSQVITDCRAVGVCLQEAVELRNAL